MNEPSEKQDSGSHSVHAHCFPGSCDQTLITVSCIVTQLTRESFGICRLRGPCWYVYERIRLNLINPKVLKIERGLHFIKMLDSASFTVSTVKECNLFTRSFCSMRF